MTALTPDEEYAQAREGVIRADEAMDRAVRRLVAQKVKAVYPTAATLVVYGEYNEDGLLHAKCESIFSEDHEVLAETHAPTQEWDELTNSVDPLLHEVSERDEDYQGETEIDLTEWDDPSGQFEIQGDYGHGWETVTAEATEEAAREQLRTYDREEPHVRHRMKRTADDDDT